MKHCRFTVSPSHPTCSCPDAVLYPRRWGVRDVRESRVEWRTCSGLHDEKERTRQREKKRKTPSIRVLSSTLPHRHTEGCCTADRWARGERRGGFNWSGISGNQSVFWSVIRSSEWVQPPLSPMPTPVPPPHTRHQPPSHSSRTCRQRWPPLALHCQRMMQQRHRRWPPPCTEGGGVTGAK